MDNRNKSIIKDKLDPMILIALLVLSTYEFEVFTFAKGVIEIAEQDAWICILLGGLVLFLTMYLLISLATQFPKENILQYSKKVWGKPLSLSIVVGYLIFWSIYLVIMFKNVSTTNNLFFLPETPLGITIFLLALGAAWLIFYGFTNLVRFFQILLPFFLIPFCILSILSLSNIKLDNFFPVLSNGIIPIIKGTLYYLGALQGLEVLLFATPFLTNSRKALKPTFIAIILLTIFDFVITIAAIGILGADAIKESMFPGIDVIRAIEFPGFPTERFSLFLTTPWLIGIFTTICLYLYLLSFGLIQVFKIKNRKLVVITTVSLTSLAAYLLPNTAYTHTLQKYITIVTLFFLYVIPLLTLLITKLRGKEEYN